MLKKLLYEIEVTSKFELEKFECFKNIHDFK